MVLVLRLARGACAWILRALGRLAWGAFLLACLCLGFLFGWGRKEQEIQEQETKAPEELAVRDEFDEDDDAQRRWFIDLGPEGRRAWTMRQAARAGFKPQKDFVPWWKQKRRA